MIQTSYLGRYECRQNGHYKFWWIVLDMSTQTYICTWGRIGNNSPPPLAYDEKKAWTKIKEKQKKGYVKVMGYEETTGSQSVHFITKMCEG